VRATAIANLTDEPTRSAYHIDTSQTPDRPLQTPSATHPRRRRPAVDAERPRAAREASLRTARTPDEPLQPDTTIELVDRAKRGDGLALEVILRRCMPALHRWAHGRLPISSRGMVETADLVQDTMIAALRRLEAFEVRHQGALQAYLRQAVMNRIRDLVRRDRRRPDQTGLPEHLTDKGSSPLEQLIGSENVARYEAAVQKLSPHDREAIVGRLELQHSYEELAVVLNKPTANAARVAVTRAMKRLVDEMRDVA
jgi:RNA polymerase sigma factor (sigma-70 family)